MKKKPLIQFGLISLSAFVIIGASFLFVKEAADFSEISVMNSQVSEKIEQVTVPLNYETRISKGNALFDSGYYSQAITEYSLASQIQEDNPQAHLLLAKTYLKLEDYESAAVEYKLILDKNPQNTEARTYYGKTLLLNKQFDEAKAVFSPMETVQEAKYYDALLEAYAGNFEESEKMLLEAEKLSGGIPRETFELILKDFEMFKDQKEGQEVYLQTVLAKTMLDLGEYQLAEVLSQEALDVKSDYRDAWMILGYALLKTKDYQGAEDAFTEAKKLDAVKNEVHYFLGTSHYFQAEYKEAITEYELALLYGFNPEREVYTKIAESQFFLGEYNDAIASYEHLAKIDSSSVDIFVRPVTIALNHLHDSSRAYALAKMAVEKFPTEAIAHDLLSWTYIEMDKLEEAEAEINKTFMLNPNLASAHYHAGLLREKQGHLEGAKWEFKRAYELAKSGDSISALAADKFNSIILTQ
ncbi:tetratricopeptide repeat protein [Patescibacteria group bacterium]|nr:tetratricopeptide repeat protein [Patescibacteria group bacterium]